MKDYLTVDGHFSIILYGNAQRSNNHEVHEEHKERIERFFFSTFVVFVVR